jgi:hypothetical protein
MLSVAAKLRVDVLARPYSMRWSRHFANSPFRSLWSCTVSTCTLHNICIIRSQLTEGHRKPRSNVIDWN